MPFSCTKVSVQTEGAESDYKTAKAGREQKRNLNAAVARFEFHPGEVAAIPGRIMIRSEQVDRMHYFGALRKPVL